MRPPAQQSRSLSTIFAWPLAIFLLGLVGLVVALTGDGWPDAAAWLALAVPVTAVVWAMRARRS